jgi:hypothetical protein
MWNLDVFNVILEKQTFDDLKENFDVRIRINVL